MSHISSFFKKLTAVLTVCSAVCFIAVFGYSNSLPESFLVTRGQEFSLQNDVISTVRVFPDDLAVGESRSSELSYTVSLKLFGLMPIKEVSVSVVDRPTLIPCGTPFGIKMFTKGVMVVSLTEVESGGKGYNPAVAAGLRIGDIILEANGEEVKSNEHVSSIISGSGGKPIVLVVQRNEQKLKMTVTPIKSDKDSEYKAGIWVRDSSAGVGTATFYDPETKLFAGLGHAICDVDTGELLPLSSGELVDVSILGVTKSKSGTPGELVGAFASRIAFGKLYANTQAGVFGTSDRSPVSSAPVKLALKQEIKEGKAYILTTLDKNVVERFEISIERIALGADNPTKNMIIRVTDENLIKRTGGIVQGMSGSPIIQDGQLVGAVTHVFVNDPTKGYAIFAENMYETANKQG